MAKSEYGKYIFREPRGQIEQDGKIVFDGLRVSSDQVGVACNVLYSAITREHIMVDKPHMHDFPHFLGFLGSNPLDLYDFDAEVEFYLGGEKHIIDATSIVFVPAGVSHCPLNFKRLGKPIMFMEVMLTSEYKRKEPDK